MGCGASSPDKIGHGHPPVPRTPEGKAARKKIDAAWSGLERQQRTVTDKATIVSNIERSTLLSLLGAEDCNADRYTFSTPLLRASLPDNGQWCGTFDPSSGAVVIRTPDRRLGPSPKITFTCGPMRSRPSTEAYVNMFRDRVASAFAGLPKMISGTLVTAVETTEPEFVRVSGVEMGVWEQRTTGATGHCSVQIEWHGMWRVAAAAAAAGAGERKSTDYGFNVTGVLGVGEKMAEALGPVVRGIVESFEIEHPDQLEKVMGAVWDKLGR